MRTYPRSSSVEIVGAYVDGRPIPFSSNAFTRLASVKRGGGCVKCCSGSSSSSRSACSAVSPGSIASASSSGVSSRPSKYTRRNPSNVIVWPVARSRYSGVPWRSDVALASP